MRVLVACESSGTVREAFRAHGHDAWSCDLLPDDNGSECHIQGDALDVLYGSKVDALRFMHDEDMENPREHWPAQEWDLLVAHPPCTRLCNSGVRWLHERNLWSDLEDAIIFFQFFQHAPIERIAIENPVPHKYAAREIGKPDQYIQPWQFGHGETKRTGLWLKNLPRLVPTDVVAGREARIHRMPPGPDWWKARSKTYAGIAQAMAVQWGQKRAGHCAVNAAEVTSPSNAPSGAAASLNADERSEED